MKNPYVKPITKAYHVNVSQMIMTASTVDVKGEDYNEGHMTDLARQFDFFEEEETSSDSDEDDFDYDDEEFEE